MCVQWTVQYSAFCPKIQFFCFGNQIFLNGAFVAVYVTIILAFELITISLFLFELKPFERGSQFFMKVFTRSHC